MFVAYRRMFVCVCVTSAANSRESGKSMMLCSLNMTATNNKPAQCVCMCVMFLFLPFDFFMFIFDVLCRDVELFQALTSFLC